MLRKTWFAGIVAAFMCCPLFYACASGQASVLAAKNAATADTSRSQEDMSTIDLSRTHLIPAKPIDSETDHAPTFTRHLVRVSWRPLDPIDLYIITPNGVARPPVVLYLYSYPSDADRFMNDRYCAELTRHGCAAVGFVSALTGSRYRFRPMKEWFVSELQESLISSTHDVQLIINYLETRKDVDAGKVAMFGQGSGGTIAILAASVDARIKAIDLLNPWGDWKHWTAASALIPERERTQLTGSAFLGGVADLDPVRILGALTHPKIRLRQVTEDPYTPVTCQEAVASALPRGAVRERFARNTDLRNAIAGGRLFAWTAEQLKLQTATR